MDTLPGSLPRLTLTDSTPDLERDAGAEWHRELQQNPGAYHSHSAAGCEHVQIPEVRRGALPTSGGRAGECEDSPERSVLDHSFTTASSPAYMQLADQMVTQQGLGPVASPECDSIVHPYSANKLHLIAINSISSGLGGGRRGGGLGVFRTRR